MSINLKDNYELIWVEQVRPRILDDVEGNEEIIENLKGFLITQNKSFLKKTGKKKPTDIPNMLFTGKFGTGKTTSAEIFALSIVKHAADILPINGSKEGTKETLKTKINDFCRTPRIDGGKVVVIIDEADNMSKPMQHAFRKDMEDFRRHFNVLFILMCNYKEKIIPPLLSRCMIYEFKDLTNENMRQLFMKVQKKLKFEIDDDCIDILIKKSGNVPRNFINLLQQLSISGTRRITKEIAGNYIAIRDEIEKIIVMMMKKKDLNEILLLCEKIMRDFSMDEQFLISEMLDSFKTFKMDEKDRAIAIARCAEADFRISQGSTPYAQTSWLIAQLYLNLKTNVKDATKTR